MHPQPLGSPRPAPAPAAPPSRVLTASILPDPGSFCRRRPPLRASGSRSPGGGSRSSTRRFLRPSEVRLENGERSVGAEPGGVGTRAVSRWGIKRARARREMLRRAASLFGVFSSRPYRVPLLEERCCGGKLVFPQRFARFSGKKDILASCRGVMGIVVSKLVEHLKMPLLLTYPPLSSFPHRRHTAPLSLHGRFYIYIYNLSLRIEVMCNFFLHVVDIGLSEERYFFVH